MNWLVCSEFSTLVSGVVLAVVVLVNTWWTWPRSVYLTLAVVSAVWFVISLVTLLNVLSWHLTVTPFL